MSSLNNYELDERHIRLVMIDSEIEVSDSDWERFEASRNKNSNHKSFQNFLPSFQFSIPKNVLFPSLFVIIIFGLSAMLYSFVDFKKANPVNSASVNVASSISAKTVSAQTPKSTIINVAKVDQPQKKETADNQDSSQKVSSIQVSDPLLVSSSDYKPQQQKIEALQTNVSDQKQKVSSESEQKTKARSKSRKKKVVYEELPSINTSSKIIETSNEPELDLK